MSLIYVFPGQGSQKLGMGAGLFERFRDLVEIADRQLGYSVEQLCLKDPQNQLAQTEFTQPALFVVNALSFLSRQDEQKQNPAFVAGHSLGEYNALFASGVFDFATGLKLVQKRGELMARVRGGAMAAVVGIKPDRVSELLLNFAFDGVDIANYNSPVQTAISGPEAQVRQAIPVFKEAGATVIQLKVSGAFHSRMMKPVQKEFASFFEPFPIAPMQIPVVANVTGLPYEPARIRETLARQIASPVRWTESIRFLLGQEDMFSKK